MIVDGKKLAEKLKEELKKGVSALGKAPRLAIVRVGEDAVTKKFLERKIKFGADIGADVRVYELLADISGTKLREKLAEIVHIKENTGVVVQLSLPKEINSQYILDGIVPEKDPDMLSSKSWGLFSTGRSKILPPVAAAIKYILDENNVAVKGKNAVVVGAGKLVGKPAAAWLMNEGATVSVVDENTPDAKHFTLNADILISGAGKPKLITPEMVKKGVIAIDAGTSESAGKMAGDIDPAVSEKASLFTPVPGGVGPLTVAMLFKNLVELAKRQH